MIIHHEQLLSGANRARGIAIVIDVLRASTNIVTMCEAGAERVLAATTLDDARGLARRFPGSILAGERGGSPPPGFELGNSPVEAARHGVAGRTVVLTTSAGSQGIVAAACGADEVWIGCFRNAQAVATRLLAVDPAEVTIVAMGTGGERAAPEDDLAAEYIAARIRDAEADLEQMFGEIRAHPEGQKFIDPTITAYPQEDLEYCLVADVSDTIPRVVEREPPTVRPWSG